MKKTLSPLAAAVTLIALMPPCVAQHGYFGPPSVSSAPMMYQPTMSTRMVFQSGDPGVPIPSDPGSGSFGTSPAPGTIQSPQNSPYDSGPMISTPDPSLPVFQDSTTWNAFSPPVMADPFLQPGYGMQPSPYAPYSPYTPYQSNIPPQGAFGYGANPPAPYRFGWQNRIDVSWLPGGSVEAAPGGATGDQDIFGVDYGLTYGTPFVPGWVLNWTNQFSYRNWNGPTGAVGLPSDLFRFGMDFEMETPASGPFSVSLGITPSVNTDFDSDVWGDGFQLDARGILFMKLDQYWTLGLGVMYWDRVDSIILPYAGLIYRDDYWEWQLMFPEAKVSLFLGNESYWSKWAYIRGEYHVEAYGVQSSLAGVSMDDQVQIADYRILGGFKMDGGLYSWFFEGGWVFDRQVTFDSATPGYDLSSGFIGQIGLRY